MYAHFAGTPFAYIAHRHVPPPALRPAVRRRHDRLFGDNRGENRVLIQIAAP
jgi:hypothetical protein